MDCGNDESVSQKPKKKHITIHTKKTSLSIPKCKYQKVLATNYAPCMKQARYETYTCDIREVVSIMNVRYNLKLDS